MLIAQPSPWVALVGPTASGKSALALALAQQIPLEIVSMDSALVYRGMDIGTAKPSAQERALVPHHLIDIRDPLQPYSAAQFAHDARQAIADIQARGRLPVVVGGTMLYLKALLEGLADMPAANAAVRAHIESEAVRLGWPALHAQLAQVDPLTAQRLAPQDAQRIQRALEVWQVTGQTLSSLHSSGQAAQERLLAQSALLISLEPLQRSWLHQRIAERFDAMLGAGFLNEVQRLRARGDLHANLPAMRCVGYRQAWALLDSLQAPSALNAESLVPTLREQSTAATRQLAKRQLTWLRSLSQRHTVACDRPDALVQVLTLVRKHARHPFAA